MNTFGDLLRQHISRKRGLSQNKLALDIDIDPSVISKMCNGKRLNGRYSRERVLKTITWLHEKDVLEFVEEANAFLEAADMKVLSESNGEDLIILNLLTQNKAASHTQPQRFSQEKLMGLLLVVVGFYLWRKLFAISKKPEINFVVIFSPKFLRSR